LKEEELLKKENSLDSTIKTDTAHIVNSALTGNWLVKMSCTETTCPGSAVGDTKSEQWQISYQMNALIAKAMSNGQLVRIYKGFYTGNTIELIEDRNNTSSGPVVKMVVRLQLVDETHLEGRREIIRDDCKVVYDLQLEKQNG
jgi:polysaccharide deacetylase 2 family uncharacterized protein YibQ